MYEILILATLVIIMTGTTLYYRRKCIAADKAFNLADDKNNVYLDELKEWFERKEYIIAFLKDPCRKYRTIHIVRFLESARTTKEELRVQPFETRIIHKPGKKHRIPKHQQRANKARNNKHS